MYDDSLPFAGLGFSHLVLKKRCEEPWTRKKKEGRSGRSGEKGRKSVDPAPC